MWACSYCDIHDVILFHIKGWILYGSHQRKQASVWSRDTNIDICQASIKINIGDIFQSRFQVSDDCVSLSANKRDHLKWKMVIFTKKQCKASYGNWKRIQGCFHIWWSSIGSLHIRCQSRTSIWIGLQMRIKCWWSKVQLNVTRISDEEINRND